MSVRPNQVSRIVSAANTTNATLAKGAAAQLYGIAGYNAAAAIRYVKLYDKATAPAVGTDVPKITLVIPASSAFQFNWPTPIEFRVGLGYGLTTGVADNDTGALTAADVTGLNIIFT